MITKITYYRTDQGFDLNFEPIEETLSVKKTKEGYEARYLIQDEMAEFPEQDDSLFMVNYHRDFCLKRDEVISEDEAKAFYRGEKIGQEKDYFIFYLTCYIHSGVTLYLGSDSNPSGVGYGHFDTSHVGLVLASKKEFTKKGARKAAEALVEEANRYLHGEVYCLVKETFDKDKKSLDHDTLGGCYGFKEAQEALETEI